jgi:hypothetical protein
MKTTKKTTSQYIQSYLNRRTTPASSSVITKALSTKTNVQPSSIRVAISRMVTRGSLLSVPLTGKNVKTGTNGYILQSN